MPSSYTNDLPNDILIDTAVLYRGSVNALTASAGLAIDAVPEKFKTTSIASYRIGRDDYTKAATTALVFSAAHVITASKFGVILIQIDADGTITTKVPLATQAYNDAPTALAALPSADSGNVALGYIAIANNTGDWIANTDDMTDASDVTTASFVNATAETTMEKFGATRGGIRFNKNTERRNVPFDGASGETAGLTRHTGGVPTLAGTTILFGPTMIQNLEVGATAETTGTDPNAVMRITAVPYRTMISVADLYRYKCVWKRGNGGTAAVVFPLGEPDMGELGSADNNEGEIPITIYAQNNPDDIDGTDEVPKPYFYEVTGPDVLAA